MAKCNVLQCPGVDVGAPRHLGKGTFPMLVPPTATDTLGGSLTVGWYAYVDGKPAPSADVCCGSGGLVAVCIDLTDIGPLRSLLCGTWCICVQLECQNPDPQGAKPWSCCVTQPFKMCDGDAKTSFCIEIPADALKCNPDPDCGMTIYKLYVSVSALNNCEPPRPVGLYADAEGKIRVVQCPKKP